MLTVRVQIHFAAEDHRAIWQAVLWLDDHTYDSDSAIADAQRFDGVSPAEAVQPLAVD